MQYFIVEVEHPISTNPSLSVLDTYHIFAETEDEAVNRACKVKVNKHLGVRVVGNYHVKPGIFRIVGDWEPNEKTN